MKKRNLHTIIICFLLFTLFTSACKKEPLFQVTKEMETFLSTKFPKAESLEWSSQKGFVVGDFRSEGYHRRIWFSSEGNWVMIETLKLLTEDLPSLIRETGRNEIKDRSKVEFPSVETRYVIQFTNFSKIYRENGELLKEIYEEWENEPIIIPEKVLQYIRKNQNKSNILDAWWIKNEVFKTQVELDGKTKTQRFFCFLKEGEWLATYFDLPSSDLEYERVKSRIKEELNKELVFTCYKVYYSPTKESEGEGESENINEGYENEFFFYFIKFENGRSPIMLDRLYQVIEEMDPMITKALS